MKLGFLIGQVLELLPPALRERCKFITYEARPEPTDEDLERGAAAEGHLAAYYYGTTVENDPNSSALPDESSPVGVVVLFTNRMKPITQAKIAKLVLHELGHALGYGHDVLEDELGLRL